MQDDVDTWFKREILVQEPSLLRYLYRVWPRREEVNDLKQEIYVRVYESATVARPPVARYFLFSVARHLLTDRLRRRRIVSIESVGDFDLSNVLVDEVSPERRLDAHQQLKRLAQALNELPPKCRQVVWMRRVEALSQKQVAERLGVSERTVESHVLKGMYLLKQALYGRAAGDRQDEASSTQQTGSEHGRHHTD